MARENGGCLPAALSSLTLLKGSFRQWSLALTAVTWVNPHLPFAFRTVKQSGKIVDWEWV